MNLSQVLLAKSIFKARIKDIDLDDPYPREKVFVRFAWENLSEEWANDAVRLLARQQLQRRIHH